MKEINSGMIKVLSVSVENNILRMVAFNNWTESYKWYDKPLPQYSASVTQGLPYYEKICSEEICGTIVWLLTTPLEFFCRDCVFYNPPIHGNEIHCAVNPSGYKFECDDFVDRFQNGGSE